jgi:small subunit ribosomal protein S17
MSKSSKEAQQKIVKGKVVSISGNKTIKVEVIQRKKHPFYHKVINITWSTLVHDEAQTAKLGDTIEFKLCRPISKKKSYILVKNTGENK